MAGGNNYKLLIEGKLSTDNIDAQIKALSNKSVLTIKTQFKDTDFKKFQAELANIQKDINNKVGKISLLGNVKGGIKAAVIEYTDALGNAVKYTAAINNNVKVTQIYTENLAKDEAGINKVLEQRRVLTAKQADEMHRSMMNAEKFLAKSKNLQQTDTVKAAAGTATQISQLAPVAVTPEQIEQVRKLNDQLAIQKAALQTGRTGLDSWTEGMRNAIKQTVEYALSIGLVYGALRQLKEGIGFVAELNKELVNIQLLQTQGARSDEEIADLAGKYNLLAKEVGATTIEVAKGSVEWLRQGKSIEETGDLLKDTMMLSKLGAVDSAQATEYLTAILNGYKLEAEDATMVIDKLIGLDNKYATSVAEIAEAMKRSTNTAQQSGVSFDELASYITVVSSTTRRSAETIGESFKTMFSRMETIKLGKYFEDETQSLSDVEKILAKDTINIKLRDSTNSFRAMGDVIDEVGKKWEKLNETDQAAVANAIAGVRQKESFLSLMSNYNKVLEAQTVITESAGLAQDRYAIYLEGVEAAQNRLTASWENLWMQTVNSGMITFFLNLSAAMLEFIGSAGGLAPVLGIVLGALIAIKGVALADFFLMMVATIQQTVTALITMGTTAQATGIAMNTAFGIVGLAIAAISVAVIAFNKYANQATENAARLAQEVNALHAEINKGVGEQTRLSGLVEEYEKLKENTHKTTEEQKRFVDVQNEISRLMPQVSVKYDEQGNAILDAGVNLKELIELKKQEIALDRQVLDDKIKESMEAKLELYAKERKELERLINKREVWLRASGDMASEKAKTLSAEGIGEQKAVFDQVENDIKAAFYSLGEEAQKVQLEVIRSMGDAGAALAEELEGTMNTVSTSVSGGMYERLAAQKDEIIEEYSGLLVTLNSIANQAKELQDMMSKSEEGKLEFSDLEKVAAIYPDYLKALSIEGDKLKLNETMLRDYAIAQATAAVEIARKNNASEEDIALLDAQAKLLAKSIPLSEDFVDSFNGIIQATSEGLTGKAKQEFDGLAGSILNTNTQFKNGEISAIEYFNVLEQQLQSADFKTMFAENEGAAQSFFTGMVANASQALYQITSEFEAGKLSVAEYIERLTELGDIFKVIGDIVVSSGEQMGMSATSISQISQSTTELGNSISQLAGMYDLVNISIAGMGSNLQFNTEAYNNWALQVANAMASVGGAWHDAAGNALVGSDAIYNYATAASGNMGVLMNQVVSKVNNLIKNATHNIAEFLRGIASNIAKFKGEIYFTPKQTGTVPFNINIAGFELPFSLPAMSMEIGANFTGAADFISGVASNIESWGASSPIDLGDFINPGGIGASTDALNGAGGAAGRLADELNRAGNEADDLASRLKEAKKAAIDALKAQLAGYKKVIDARKKLLDSMQREREYQQDIDNQTDNILDIQNELAVLQLDDSEEAAARRRQLEDELATANQELENTRQRHSTDVQKEALDADYAAFEERINNAIQQIEAINATSMEDFASQLAIILAQVGRGMGGGGAGRRIPGEDPYDPSGGRGTIPPRQGRPVDPSGGRGTIPSQYNPTAQFSNNSVLSRMASGESIIPQNANRNFVGGSSSIMADGGGNGDVNIQMPLQVMGNLDKSVLPNIEKIVETAVKKLIENMSNRGYVRRADTFGL